MLSGSNSEAGNCEHDGYSSLKELYPGMPGVVLISTDVVPIYAELFLASESDPRSFGRIEQPNINY